jgi:hypothetical protein
MTGRYCKNSIFQGWTLRGSTRNYQLKLSVVIAVVKLKDVTLNRIKRPKRGRLGIPKETTPL